LGGRLDSTNVVHPLVSVITNIGLDHTQFLGTTLPAIAIEKGGIIKENVPVVVGEYHPDTFPVFENISVQKKAKLYKAFELEDTSIHCELKGAYQKHNIKTALKTVEVLNNLGVEVSKTATKTGLAKVTQNTGLLGRYQMVQEAPKILCDTGHNKEGISLVVQQLLQEQYQQLHIVFGVVEDKDLRSVLPLLPKNAHYYFTKPSIARGLSEKKLKLIAEKHGLIGAEFSTVAQGVSQAILKATTEDLIYVGGSTFVVADFLSSRMLK